MDVSRNPDGNPLPATCGIAFKEWAGICQALTDGRQSLILRKGGIAEGPRGFVPEHDAFWLYPTHLHEAEQGLRVPMTTVSSEGPDGCLPLRALAVVEHVGRVESREALAPLRDLHVWTDETVQKRFDYRRPGLWVLGVRVFRLDDPWWVSVTPEHAGCKTWVPLDESRATDGLVPVLDDETAARRREALRLALEKSD